MFDNVPMYDYGATVTDTSAVAIMNTSDFIGAKRTRVDELSVVVPIDGVHALQLQYIELPAEFMS